MCKTFFLRLLVVLIIPIMLISVPQNAEAAAQIYLDAAAGPINARIYEAVALPDGNIGAVFNRGGNIMYGILNISKNEWTVVSLGITASSDVNAASLSLDVSGRPHIVFVNTVNDLVYRFFDGSAWTPGQIIDSRNIAGSGVLFSPDIAIDAAGKAHIAYMDSRGGHMGGEGQYIRNDLMCATNVTGSWVITVRQFGDGSHASVTHNDWREAIAPPKISLTVTDSPIGAVYYDRHRTGSSDTDISFNFSYRIYRSIGPFLEAPLIISNTDQRARFSLFDTESDGITIFSLFRNINDLYLKNGVNEIAGTRLNFATSAADFFVDRADQNKLYYAAISGSALQLYQDGVFKGPLTLPIALSGIHTKAATVVIGTFQYVLYTDSNGRLQTVSYKTTADASVPLNSAGFPRVTGETLTGFTLEAQVDESSRIFYIAVEDGSTVPTSAQIVAGVNYGGVTIRASGNFAVLPNSINRRVITGLVAATNYDLYVVARDGEENLQDLPTLINVATVTPIAVINISAIPGVNAPVTGATPVTSIAETNQYEGNIVWSPVHATFAPGATYTATITLTPKRGFTLTGVTENFFTVAAAVSTTNVANSGVVTAVFPATAVPVTGLAVVQETATINYGSDVQLIATVTPANATNKNLTWSSNNKTVATVSPTGMVTGVGAGTATITVSTVGGGKTATSTITVVIPHSPSNNAELSELTLSSGTLVPVFAQSTTAYTVNVGNAVSSIDVRATALHAAVSMTINDENYVSSGIWSMDTLVVGVNFIKIEITAEDRTTKKTYTITVNRAAIPPAPPEPAPPEPAPTEPAPTEPAPPEPAPPEPAPPEPAPPEPAPPEPAPPEPAPPEPAPPEPAPPEPAPPEPAPPEPAPPEPAPPEPAPPEPAPPEPAPPEPAPTEPAPPEPAPPEPAPTEPAPTEPAPTEPAPTEPAPPEPAPTEPAPPEPAPPEPAPTEPAPPEPAPPEPAPTEPAPTEPAPPEPAPTEPIPVPALTLTPIPPAFVEKFIVANKSTIVKLEGVVEIIIAAGAIRGEAPTITAQVVSKVISAPLQTAATGVDLIEASKIVEITLTGGELVAPVQLTMNYDTTMIAEGKAPSVFVYNERTKRWIYLGGQVGDGTITVTANKFSKFSVFATKPLASMTDIADHWGRDSVNTLAGMGIVSGYPDGKFNSDAKITRAEFISMLMRALYLNSNPDAAIKFKDADGWAKGAIGAAAYAGLVTGYADGTFGGSLKITRAEMAVILKRVIHKELVSVNFNIGIKFDDAKDFPNWAEQAINMVSKARLARGFPDRTFRPASTATRAEAVAMLYRLVAKM